MKTPNFRPDRVAAAVAAAMLTLAAPHTFATGFQLNEQSASSLGNAFAAGATFTDDASGMWWNAAALAPISRTQVVGSLNVITPMIKFHNENSVAATNQPSLGGEGGDSGNSNWVPNLYLAVPINPQWTFGLGVNSPFGLVTHYGDGWLGRYQGLKSDVQTINVNPVITWKVTPQFAVGVGADYQHIKATFTSNVNYSAALLQAAGQAAAGGLISPALIPVIGAATPGLDSFVNLHGDDDAWGWNIGAMWDVTPAVRVGASYRSAIKYKVEGTVDITNPAVTAPPALAPVLGVLVPAVNAQLASGGITADIKLPEIANLSVHWQYDPRWEIMGDVQWTGWSSIKDLTFVRTNGVVLQSTPENFDDTWKVALGASYRYNDQWKARMGVAWDKTPVNDTDRTVRLPDSDRFWLSLGGQYRVSPNLWFDAAFTYIWGQKANMNQNAGSTAANGLVNGHYDAAVTIFAGQVTYQF